MMRFNLLQKIRDYKQRQRVKEVRRTIRKGLKKIFNKKTMTKVLIVFSSLALIASYILPYLA